MSLEENNYNHDIFMNSFPNILENEDLREPQIRAYVSLYKHFITEKNSNHALVVLPTGVGKTGVMGIAPYHISKGKVLIIAPRVAIKDNLIKQLDPINPRNFWIRRKIFHSPEFLPNVCEYNPKLSKDVLDNSNIIILNAQKLQARLESSILNFLPKDYFDLIIIDEAHHSTAKTWDDAISYFSGAKIIKLTGTPFRTDGQKIEGELVYNYKLGLAMARSYIKSLENISYIPDELYLTIDENESIQYTVQQIYDLGLKDEDWVTRSVAFSMECSEKVVDRSIEFLHRKKNASNIPHKIIAVACSIFHANQIKSLYESKGLKVAIIHSKLEQKGIEKAFSDIENNRVEVVVNVAMLGEGYDHPYLSVAAIFRPFKAELPYIQFIGRILRYIDDENATPIDNVGQIISHKNLELDDLWRKYKKEIDESEIIKRLINDQDIDDLWEDENENEKDSSGKVIQFGQAYEYGQGTIVGDSYIDTELLKKAKAIEKEEQKKIDELIKLLGVTELQARTIVRSTSNTDLSYKRPDIMYINSKQGLDTKIRGEIVPELITEFNLNKEGKDLANLPFFSDSRYQWIVPQAKDNAALLAMLFNKYLKDEIGSSRDKWSQDDYKMAYQKLETIVQYIKTIL
ncbi:MAG: DEAD/DEAH box helicase family protein [Bacteroides sp.]|nr:DEAD/DEAH box helicase family protein [Syntrophomonadaceae bacterium]MDD4720762.1 DEAD/DEAH box helicase family protein [Bacteroides sp.]